MDPIKLNTKLPKNMAFIFIILGFLALESCNVQGRIVVRTRPLEPEVEVPPPPPYSGAFWIRGEWVWAGPNRGYVWHRGHYEAFRTGSEWIGGHWQNTRWGWHWIPGHWR